MGLDKIWVFGEANGDAVASITLEMLAAARELADTVEVFMAGDGDDFAEELGEHGAETVYRTLAERNIGGGLPLGRYFPEREDEMLFAFTELSTKEDIDNLASELALVFSKDLREANA